MALNQNHTINKYQFDVVLQKEKDYPEISQTLTQLFYQELQGEIEKIFSSQSLPPELILTINQIVIDLGEISRENLKQEFKSKFIDELSQSIRKAILSNSGDSNSTIHISAKELELIRYYLRLGSLPWWSSILMKSLDSVFSKLILSEARAVKQLVFEEAIYPIPRSRIIQQFRDPTIYALFGIISSESADYYKDYTDNLIAIHQHSKITNDGDIKYKKVIQDLTFIYLLDQKGTSINQYDFFKTQIKSLAVKYDFDYYTLVKQIFFSSQEILGIKENKRTPLAKLSKTLYEEEILLDRTKVNPDEQLKLVQKILEELLTRGASSLPLQKLGFTKRDEIFQWLAEAAPKLFVTRYRILGKEWLVRDRTLTLFDDTSLAVLFEKAAPQKKPVVFDVFKILETIQEEITPTNQETIAFKKVIRHFALEILVFQDLNTITDEVYFQHQLQMFSKKYNISEIGILFALDEAIESIKKYKRGYFVLKKILNKSKELIIQYQNEDEIGFIPQDFAANIFIQLQQHYSSEILERLKKIMSKYGKTHLTGLKNQTQIYLFVIQKLKKLTGDHPAKILEVGFRGIDDKIKKQLINTGLFEKTKEEVGSGAFKGIEYLIELLKETPLKEWISNLGEKSPKDILIELIFERGSDLAAFLVQQKYDIHLSKIFAGQLDLVEFRHLIKQFGLEKSDKILAFLENIMMIQERWKIGRTSKNQFDFFLKEQVIRFIQSGKQEEVEMFVLDQMKEKGLMSYKNLAFFRGYIDYSEDLWPFQAIAGLILESSALGRAPIKSIQRTYLQDLVLHYLAYGSIPSWAEKNVYDMESIKLFFNAIIKEANVNFAYKLSEVLVNQPDNPRIFDLIEEGMEFQFLKWFENIPSHYNLTNVIGTIRQLFQINKPKEFDKKVIEAIVRFKIWLVPDKQTRLSILQHFLLANGFRIGAKQMVKDEWLFIYELLFGRIMGQADVKANQQQVLEKIQKHPLRFFEVIKKIPNPEMLLVKIFKQLPRAFLIHWILTVLDRGNFPVRVKNYGVLTIRYFGNNPQNKYLERYIASFLVHLLFSEPFQSYRIKRFFEAVERFPRETSSEIMEIFLKSTPSEKKSLWQLYSRQISLGNTYQLPERLKQNWYWVLHYLQYGSIPFTGEQPLGIEQMRLNLLKLLAEAPAFMRNKLYRLLRADTTRKSLTRLLQPGDIPIVLKLIHPNLERDWNQISELINKSSLEQSIRTSLGWLDKKAETRAILYTWVKGNYFFSGTAEIIVPLIKEFAKKERIEPNLLMGLIGAKDGNRGGEIVKEINSLLKKELRQEKKAYKESLIGVEKKEDEINGVYINNAGLALLWPFLGRYFKRLNMIKDGDFISEEIRMKGVQLTQYLVTGNTEIDESELTLNKLLCGADKDLVIEYDLDISAEEIALSDSLLQGVLYNWEKMRGTRPETFRQTFLQREGVLRKAEDYYELKVEEKSYDMLLTTLPWNLSMIKLAWMKSRLTVIWK